MLDLHNFIPFYLTATFNAFAASSSRIYLRQFGVGMAEWRVISMLALRPGMTASLISQRSGIDKSSVSRAVKTLAARRCLRISSDPSDERRSHLYLTKAGVTLHNRMIQTVLDHEKRLVAGFTKAEHRQLLGFLHRLLQNAKQIDTLTAAEKNGCP